MIEIVDITGIKYEVDKATKKYIIKKINQLSNYLPRQVRRNARASAKLKQINQSRGEKYEVEITLSLPHKTLIAKESTNNILAAIDIVEAKIYSQVRRYKDESKKDTPQGTVAWLKYSLRHPKTKE
jgi:putative sigma-54 modulation protein